jgi:hypothetical protein
MGLVANTITTGGRVRDMKRRESLGDEARQASRRDGGADAFV